MRRMKKKHWSFLAVLIVSVILLTAGCGSQAGSTAQQASEDTSEAATAGNTEEDTAVTEEVKITGYSSYRRSKDHEGECSCRDLLCQIGDRRQRIPLPCIAG